MKCGPVIGRRTGKDPVVVFRKTLCFRQRLLSTCGSADKIRMFRRFTVVLLHLFLSKFGHDMRGPVSEISPDGFVSYPTVRAGGSPHICRYHRKAQAERPG